MVFVSGTRFHLRSWRFLLRFIFTSQRSAYQARKSEGNLGVRLYRDPHGVYWTCTLWRNEAAMRSFMMSGAHSKAMPYAKDWADEASIVHWTQESSDMPTWKEVSRRMKLEGRKTNLSFPSPAHENSEVPEF